MNEETQRLLQEADWCVIRRKLLAHTIWRAEKYWWRRGIDFELAEGMTVEDVTQEVIFKAMSGIRKWEPSRGELLPWLQAQINSVIDALAKSAPHRHEVGLLEAKTSPGICASDPLECILDEETKMQMREHVNALLEVVETETELKEILELVLAGCDPRPRYLAAELGVSVGNINNRLKRLRRRALMSVITVSENPYQSY